MAKRTFSGLTIEITPLGFIAQRRAFVILAKALGPALLEFLAGATAGDLDDAKKTETLRKAAIEALDGLDLAKLEALTDIFADGSIAHFPDGKKLALADSVAIERAFGGANFPRYLAWLRASVEENFGPFFSSFGAGATGAAPVASTPT